MPGRRMAGQSGPPLCVQRREFPILGRVTFAATPHGLCLLSPGSEARVEAYLAGAFRGWERAAASPVCEDAAEQLSAYLAGEIREFTVPTAPLGTPFQRRVWAALVGIPYGETRTYAEIAAEIGHPRAARAVGAANGANPICVVVPCHRVVGAGGRLTGYAHGLEMKERLLALEASPRAAGRSGPARPA